MIGRDLKSLYIAPAALPGASTLEIVDLRTADLPGAGGQPGGPERRDPRPCRSGRLRPDRARAGDLRHRCRRSAARSRLEGEPIVIRSPREAIDRGIYLVPEDRKRASLLLDLSVAENISLPDLALLCARDPGRPPGGGRERRAAEAASSNIRAPSVAAAGRHAVGRQPAEGRAGALAVDAAARDHLRRADPRHRRRRQERDLRADARARRPGRRDPDDLERHGGGDRGERPDRGDARGRDQRLSGARGSSASATCCSSPSATG